MRKEILQYNRETVAELDYEIQHMCTGLLGAAEDKKRGPLRYLHFWISRGS